MSGDNLKDLLKRKQLELTKKEELTKKDCETITQAYIDVLKKKLPGDEGVGFQKIIGKGFKINSFGLEHNLSNLYLSNNDIKELCNIDMENDIKELTNRKIGVDVVKKDYNNYFYIELVLKKDIYTCF
jgi:hypothetical protein